MKKNRIAIGMFLVLVLALAACGPRDAGSGDPMDQATPEMADPTAEMMEPTGEMMQPTEEMMGPTAEMMEPTGEVMETPTSEMMEPTGEMMETPTGEMMESTPEGDMMAEPAQGMMEAPGWFSAPLTDVRTGEDFTIRDFKGKVVLVETMAQWCPTCKRQQQEVKALLENLGMPADLVVVVLDIDPNEDAASLKEYADQNGFDWIYAVPPAEVSREIGNLYGDHFLNPPSAPILVIDREGQAHPLPFGVKSAADLQAAVDMYLGEM